MRTFEMITKVKTDGSAADNAAAVEAVRLMTSVQASSRRKNPAISSGEAIGHMRQQTNPTTSRCLMDPVGIHTRNTPVSGRVRPGSGHGQ